MEICIIGGGFSGIISAKISKYHNLIPFILDKNPEIGVFGKVFPSQIGVLESVCTNTLGYLFTFSDYLWMEKIMIIQRLLKFASIWKDM